MQDQLDPGSLYQPLLVNPIAIGFENISSGMNLGCQMAVLDDPPLAARAVDILTGDDDSGGGW